MEEYKKVLCNIAVLSLVGLGSLCLLYLQDYFEKLLGNFQKHQRLLKEKEETYKRLFGELFSHSIWCDDYSTENEQRYGRVAELLLIINSHNAYFSFFRAIARQLQLESSSQPTVGRALCMKMCEYLNIEVRPDFMKLGTPSDETQEWDLIAKAIGIDHFKESYGKKLPIPFIMHAFCEVFPYL